MVKVMSQSTDFLNTSGYNTADLIRVNYFVVREDADARRRNEDSVKALEEALVSARTCPRNAGRLKARPA
jgi:hypothetical protein